MAIACRTELRERLPARPESIAPLRQAVVAFAGVCGASERLREDIALAVSEALSNAVLHAYVGADRPGPVAVQASARPGALEVVVSDEGGGMRADRESPGLGLGLSLIGHTTEQLAVENGRAAGGVTVRMLFALG